MKTPVKAGFNLETIVKGFINDNTVRDLYDPSIDEMFTTYGKPRWGVTTHPKKGILQCCLCYPLNKDKRVIYRLKFSDGFFEETAMVYEYEEQVINNVVTKISIISF